MPRQSGPSLLPARQIRDYSWLFLGAILAVPLLWVSMLVCLILLHSAPLSAQLLLHPQVLLIVLLFVGWPLPALGGLVGLAGLLLWRQPLALRRLLQRGTAAPQEWAITFLWVGPTLVVLSGALGIEMLLAPSSLVVLTVSLLAPLGCVVGPRLMLHALRHSPQP